MCRTASCFQERWKSTYPHRICAKILIVLEIPLESKSKTTVLNGVLIYTHQGDKEENKVKQMQFPQVLKTTTTTDLQGHWIASSEHSFCSFHAVSWKYGLRVHFYMTELHLCNSKLMQNIYKAESGLGSKKGEINNGVLDKNYVFLSDSSI